MEYVFVRLRVQDPHIVAILLSFLSRIYLLNTFTIMSNLNYFPDPIINSSQISQDEHDTSMEQDYQESHSIDTTTARSEGASVSSSSINPIDFDSDVPPDRPYVNSQQPLINFNLYRSESVRLETYR